MSKKGTIEVFQTKISRNDRFAQMSHQEKLIEQKKREIQAKIEQNIKAAATEKASNSAASKNKSPAKPIEKKAFNFNTFSNDGSFLNQFKSQLKDKKTEKKSFKSKETYDRYNSEERNKIWSQRNQTKDAAPKTAKPRISRFSDKPPNFEPKININTSYSNLISQQNFDGQAIITAEDVTGLPLLKKIVLQPAMQFPLPLQNTISVIAAPPILLNVPPPQMQLQNTQLVLPSTAIEITNATTVEMCPPAVISTVTLPQPMPSEITDILTVPGVATIELANIPPPNPIQLHNIPQPEPMNTLTIPPPAPLQVQNIPPPSPIQLNEIPNPKPLDILSIPTPSDSNLDNMSDPDFIKNIPPPNKSVPPPNLPENNINLTQTNIGLSQNNINLSQSNMNLSQNNMNLPQNNMNLPQNNMHLSQNNINLSQNNINLSQNNINLSQNSMNLPQNNINLAHNSINLSQNNANLSQSTLSNLNLPLNNINLLQTTQNTLNLPHSNINVSQMVQNSLNLTQNNINVPQKNLNLPQSNMNLLQNNMTLSQNNINLPQNINLSQNNISLSQNNMSLSQNSISLNQNIVNSGQTNINLPQSMSLSQNNLKLPINVPMNMPASNPSNNKSNPPIPTCLPPPNIMPPTSMPPPPQQSMSTQIHQNLLVPPPQQVSLQNLPPSLVNAQNILNSLQQQQQNMQQLQLQTMPSPQSSVLQNLQAQSISITLPMAIQNLQNSLPVLQQGVTVSNAIPPLMGQPIMPPPGMGIVPPPMNMNCPPPLIQNPVNSLQLPPPGFINQLPQHTQIMTMSLPPPLSMTSSMGGVNLQNIKDLNTGTADYEAMASLGRMVAQCGPGIEDVVRQRKNQDPSLWFLFYKESAAYQQYQQLIDQFKSEFNEQRNDDYRPEDIYEPDLCDEDDDQFNAKLEEDRRAKRKRKSRWGGQDSEGPTSPGIISPGLNAVRFANAPTAMAPMMLTKLTRTDPGLIQYAVNTFGSANISEEDWKKAEDHYKINMLYQDMLRRRNEVESLQRAGWNKYEYDSDEEVEGGTWEHKVREKEMVATQLWANELTRQAEGKHHIGDFLPPEEFKKFMEKSQAVKEGRNVDISDYKEFKLKEDNVGFKMLQKLGWSEGQGLGTEGRGIVEPINKGNISNSNQGLGLDLPENIDTNDDEYDAYRKRMMLAYRFRPNPLNNPRRPYY